MTSVGIVANGDKEAILEAITKLQNVIGLRIIFVKQSDEKLYIVTDRVFNMVNGEDAR